MEINKTKRIAQVSFQAKIDASHGSTTAENKTRDGLPSESLSERDSTSGSASTSPTSDTTASATDTDPGDCPREPLQVIEQIPSIK